MIERAAEERARSLARLECAAVDLLVIGGGIVGSRIAFEAARSGLSVALVDAGDFGGATSSASSKLVHGGLRYLATYDLALVRQLQAERVALVGSVAPHLVRPLPLLLAVPAHSRALRGKLTAALALYGALGGFRRPLPRRIDGGSVAGLVPALQYSALGDCGLVMEAQTHDARLTLATVRAAAAAGALTLNHVNVVGFLCRRGAVAAAVLEDAVTGTSVAARCRAVVNASGPWIDHVRRLEQPGARPIARLSKGVHALLRLDAPWSAGIALFDETRSALAVPWQGMLMLGTTDSAYDGDPAQVAPTDEEIADLRGAFEDVLPADVLAADRVVHAFAGLRVLPPGGDETWHAERRSVTEVSRGGMVSIAGGKLTQHRRAAIDALALLPAAVRPRRLSATATPLPGAMMNGAAAALRERVDSDVAQHLLHLYGSEARRLLAYSEAFPDALERIDARGPDVWAQAHFAVDEERAVRTDDVLARRTTLAVRGLAGSDARERIADKLRAHGLDQR